MFPRHGTLIKLLVRNASTASSKKIPIQLLKDVPNYGVKGQILQVSPALMRNLLHVDNKACYITKTQGPRIPVVEVQKPEPKKKVIMKPESEEEKQDDLQEALSLDQLSGLFSSMRSTPLNKKMQFDSEPETIEAKLNFLLEVQDGIADVTSFELDSVPQPLDAKALAQLVYKRSGVHIPLGALSITTINGDSVSAITERGEYRWKFGGEKDRSVEKKLVVF